MLFRLLRLWAPPSVANISTARPEWAKSTGWGTRVVMNDWYGVSARYVEEGDGNVERVTAMKLPMNGLCGELVGGSILLSEVFGRLFERRAFSSREL